jgi:hypothetical protein
MKIPMNLHPPPPSSPVYGKAWFQREDERRMSEEREVRVKNDLNRPPFVYKGE